MSEDNNPIVKAWNKKNPPQVMITVPSKSTIQGGDYVMLVKVEKPQNKGR